MVQQTSTVLSTSRTEYDDSNFPTTDVYQTYITADLRDAKSAIVEIKNTSPDAPQKSLDARIRVSASPSATIPDGTDDSWVVLAAAQGLNDGAANVEIPPVWSWCRVDLKNTNAEEISQAKVWLKVKLI